MNIKRFFLRIKIFICLYNDILNQNLSISKTAIYHLPHFLAHEKVHISELSGQILTNLPRMCEKKFLCKSNEAQMAKLYKTKNLSN